MDVAKYIEHTLLKPEATVEQIMQLCQEAAQYHFGGVCINPCYVPLAKHLLRDTGVKIVTVVGFPLGATFSSVKAVETAQARLEHADEIDMVMNISAFKTGDYQAVVEDIKQVVAAAEHCPVKVIIETCLLTDEEKIKACELVALGGAAIVKTSTGFNKGGATLEDVRLLRQEADKWKLGVKAAGGIRDAETALAMIEAGADRLGCSAGVKIMESLHE